MDCAKAVGAGELTTAVMRGTALAVSIHVAPRTIRNRAGSRSMIVATVKAWTT